MQLSFSSRHITSGKLNGVAAVSKEKRYTRSFLVSKLNSLSQHKLQQAERPYTKSVGDYLRVHPGVSCWNNDGCPLQ